LRICPTIVPYSDRYGTRAEIDTVSAKPLVRVVGVFAHPDDDLYTMGGTLALHARDVGPTLVFCTSGDAGPIWVEGIATRETLGRVREGEQAAAMEALGVGAHAEFLRHPDYHLPEVPFEQLVGEIEEVLRRARPGLVVTFGEDGLTGHHDHIRTGAAADAAFHRVREGVTDGAFQLLFHVAIPRSAADRFHEQLRSVRASRDLPVGSLLDLAGPADRDIAVAVDIRAVAATKLRGIEAHRTQIGELDQVPEEARWLFFETEWFVQAWPAPEPGQPVVPDLLAGLEASRSKW
jgi:LmbE family N-acetylglucosaminyl deacetylase